MAQRISARVRAQISGLPILHFRDGKYIRPADPVVVLGFPYAGLLATAPQVTTGAVSALAGLRDDTRYLQLTAPVQPGNSGGPLLDLSGNVVGIVSARDRTQSFWSSHSRGHASSPIRPRASLIASCRSIFALIRSIGRCSNK
jgi:Trypsin-like peptidase domain